MTEYAYLDYHQIIDRLLKINSTCSAVKVFDAELEFPGLFAGRAPLLCGAAPCRFLFASSVNLGAEVFLSGEVHGNERVGPTAVVALLDEVCAAGPGLARILSRSRLIAIPLANPEGYFLNRREEAGIDPNRDFPYMNADCLKTLTARVVSEIFARNQIQLALTFHGGCRAIAYPWGSRNHLLADKSTLPPDYNLFRDLAAALQLTGGPGADGMPYFPVGAMTDLVYAVDGGMEDWAYGAAFEAVPISACGHRRPARASAIFLVELSDEHTPPGGLGRPGELLSPGGIGYVTRAVRLMLRTLELATPDIFWQRTEIDGLRVSGEFVVSGCLNFQMLRVTAGVCGSSGVSEIFQNAPGGACTSILEFEVDRNRTEKFSAILPPEFAGADVCLSASAVFDPSWQEPPAAADPPRLPALARALLRHFPSLPLATPLRCVTPGFIFELNPRKMMRLVSGAGEVYFTGCCSGAVDQSAPVPCPGCAIDSRLRLLTAQGECVFGESVGGWGFQLWLILPLFLVVFWRRRARPGLPRFIE